MAKATGKFTISYASIDRQSEVYEKDGIYIGRLETCDVVLEHKAVSRIHAAINFRDGRYTIANISSSNTITLNGRLLGPKKDDVLADGDTVQIGPFTIMAAVLGKELLLVVERQFITLTPDKPDSP